MFDKNDLEILLKMTLLAYNTAADKLLQKEREIETLKKDFEEVQKELDALKKPF